MNEVFKKEWRLYTAVGRRPQFRGLERRESPKEFDWPLRVGEIRIFADMNRPFVALVLESRGAIGYLIVPVSPFTVPASAREMLVGERVYQLWNACTAAKGFVERSWLVATLEAVDVAEIATAVAAVPSGARSEDETAREYERAFAVSGGDFRGLTDGAVSIRTSKWRGHMGWSIAAMLLLCCGIGGLWYRECCREKGPTSGVAVPVVQGKGARMAAALKVVAGLPGEHGLDGCKASEAAIVTSIAEDAAVRIESAQTNAVAVREPLPAFDAARVTGDELVALLKKRKTATTAEEYAELNRRLKGRELVFHGLRINGSSETRPRRTHQDYSLLLCTDPLWANFPDEGVHVHAHFLDDESVRYAERIKGSFWGERLKEVAGVVTDAQPFAFGRRSSEIQLEVTALVPVEPLESLPDFDPSTVTGDELALLCKTLKMGMTDSVYRDLNAILLDRELTFTNAQVIDTADAGEGFTDILCSLASERPLNPGETVKDCLCVVARVPDRDIDALPWGFASQMRIMRLTGKVTTPFESKHHCFRGLPLEEVTFDVAWKDERLPAYDATTITGDELVKLLASFRDEARIAKRGRICRDIGRRRLTFAEAKVKSHSRSGGEVLVTLGFGAREESRWGNYAYELLAVFSEGEAADTASRFTRGQTLRNITAEISAFSERYPNRIGPNCCLFDVEFESEPPKPLPAFDAAKITGDELVKMIWSLGDELSLAQRDELQTQLAGRRLTFHGMELGGGSLDPNGRYVEVRMSRADNPHSEDCRVFSFRARLREPLDRSLVPGAFERCTVTATFTAQGKKGGYGFDMRFALEDAVIVRSKDER